MTLTAFHSQTMNNTINAAIAATDEMAQEPITNATPNIGIAGDRVESINSNTITTLDNVGVDGVIHINTQHGRHQAAGHRKPRQPLTPENPATVANSLGIAWSVAKTSVDNASSAKWGVALRQTMDAQGIAEFQRGDIVIIEIGLGAQRYRLSGRASRKSTAYYWIKDLAQAGGIGLHVTFNLVITSVHSALGTTVFDGGAR